MWRGKINTLLDQLDEMETVSIERQAWIKEKDVRMPTLILEMKVKVGNVESKFDFMLEPVLIRRKRRVGGRYGPTKLVDEEKASWKLFHDLFKLKVTAARLGAVEIHHAFMSYIAKQLPDDSIGTWADFMNLAIQSPGGLEALQLEDKREAKAIDAEVVDTR